MESGLSRRSQVVTRQRSAMEFGLGDRSQPTDHEYPMLRVRGLQWSPALAAGVRLCATVGSC
jgi:hypothetical protein